MLRLYMDQHVPAAITSGLRERRVDVLTVYDDGHAEADDEVIFARATELARVMFTRDSDFLQLAHDAQTNGVEFSGVVYAHQMTVSIGDAIRDLELICHVVSDDEMQNQVYWLPI